MKRYILRCPVCRHEEEPMETPTQDLGDNWSNLVSLQKSLGYKADYIYIGGPHPTKINRIKKGYLNIDDRGYVVCSSCEEGRMRIVFNR